MIVAPPREPTTSRSVLSRPSTIAGDMLESGRLSGAIAFTSPWISPQLLGRPGATVKSSMMSFSSTPVPGTVTPHPYRSLSV